MKPSKLSKEKEGDSRVISRESQGDERRYEASLRPKLLDEFVGQTKLKENLKVFIEAARRRKEPLDHVLFFGPPGLGKTTLAYIIARELGAEIHTSSGPVLERAGDLAGLLTNLQEGDVLFIDEIHRLSHVVEEYLYPAMEDFMLDIMIDKGPSARSIKLNLPRFTLVGATTRSALLTSPMRARFGVVNRIGYYTPEELEKIVERSARILNVPVEPEGVREIALRARGTPRIANRLLRRVRDFAEVDGKGVITAEIASRSLERLEVDNKGLDEMDKRILEAIIHQFKGGPVGAGTLSVAIAEDVETLEEIYEPYLIQQGFLKRTSSGRVATQNAYDHFGVPAPEKKAQGDFLR